MNKYDNYIETEISWLKKIPSHWTTFRFIDNVNLRHGFQFRDYDFTDSGLKVIKISQLSPDGYLDLSDCSFISLDRLSSFRSILIKEGDILMALTGGTIGKIIRVGEVNEPLLQNYRVGNFFPKPTQLNKIFTYYLLASQITEEQINYLLNRNGQPNIGKESFKNMFFPQPPMEEQTAIAEYLDTKTQAIDKKVSILEKKIGYYQELRKSLINETVTKGLNKNVKLTEGDLELRDHHGISHIPEHWNTHRLDWITSIVRGNTGFGKDELLSNGEYVALQYGKTYQVDEVNNTFQYFVNSEFYKQTQVVNRGDTILISTSETIEDLGHSCFYNRDDFGLIGGEQILLKPNPKYIFGKYLYYCSKKFGSELRRNATGLKVYRFNTDDLKQIFVALPPLEEQIQIANYLTDNVSKIDQIITNIQTQITTLKELRKTLINDVVTGKIKVIQD